MNRSLIALATIASVAVVVPATAQDDVPPAGRFQLAPGEGSGFVRLDTRTGAVSHCRQNDGVWRCEPIIDSVGLEDRLNALSDKVDRLASGLDSLSLRIDELAADVSRPTPPVVAAADDKPVGKPRRIAQAAVYRLLEMIRVIKHGSADRT
jgi:outer membrane murein-binding lipoprotein Lpp